MSFTKEDIQQIEKKGLTVDKVKSQIELFKSGVSFINLKEAATVGNGILKLTEKEEEKYATLFNEKYEHKKIVKFVPASGAATRMFEFLFEFLTTYNSEKETVNAYINRHKANALSIFLIGLEKLPFFEDVVFKVHRIIDNFNDLTKDKQLEEFVRTMLDEDRLNYSFYPKGLSLIHI